MTKQPRLSRTKPRVLFGDGWLVRYNFSHPHEALGDKTPAQKAGIRFPFKNWLDVVKHGGTI